MVNWQAIGNFIVALAPYVVALAIGVGSWIWGRNALKGKDDVIVVLKEQIASQKDLATEVKQAKDAHIQTLEQLRPARLQQDLADLHKYYDELVDRTKRQAAEQIKELETKHNPEERKKLEETVTLLNMRLVQAEAGREAAERLARDALSPYPSTLLGMSNYKFFTGNAFTHTAVELPYISTGSLFANLDPDELRKLGITSTEAAATEHDDGERPDKDSDQKA